MNSLTTYLYDLVGLGTPVVDILYTKEGKREELGGTIPNTIAYSQVLGLKTALIGRTGTDNYGEQIITELNELGVDTSRVRRRGLTSRYYITTTPEERIIHHIDYYKPLKRLSKPDKEFILSSKSVYLNIANLLFEDVVSTISTHPVKLFLNLQNFEPKEYILELLLHASVDTIFGNETEVEKIRSIMKNLLEGSTKILMTQGRRGCCLYASFGIKNYTGYRVETVDTTVAGDAFAAGFIYGMLNQWSLNKSCDFANRMGALATTFYGARSRLPTQEEIWSLE